LLPQAVSSHFALFAGCAAAAAAAAADFLARNPLIHFRKQQAAKTLFAVAAAADFLASHPSPISVNNVQQTPFVQQQQLQLMS